MRPHRKVVILLGGLSFLLLGLFLIEDSLSCYSGLTAVFSMVDRAWYESPGFHISIGFVIMIAGFALITLEVRAALLSGEFS